MDARNLKRSTPRTVAITCPYLNPGDACLVEPASDLRKDFGKENLAFRISLLLRHFPVVNHIGRKFHHLLTVGETELFFNMPLIGLNRFHAQTQISRNRGSAVTLTYQTNKISFFAIRAGFVGFSATIRATVIYQTFLSEFQNIASMMMPGRE
jgi:hypothetical protein